MSATVGHRCCCPVPRLAGPYHHGAWAVVANIADHRAFCTVAALRRLDRQR